ncbi:MAG: pyrimidine 5'-nucleotidase [Burkholderiales bacterium]|nr:pyrimidine 5'-nucleotidase [Burkholderiales bacterium]
MRTWLLDLDNTLHDAMPEVFPRINREMTAFMVRELDLSEEEASALRAHYWQRYGATLLGLIRHHGIDPHRFLRETHPFPDLEQLVRRDLRLVHALRRLPGRRIVVTNAPLHYASRVVRALGIWAHIEAIVSIESMSFAGRWQPKPSRPMLRRLLARLRVRAADCVLVEDSVENLAGACWIGVKTVLVTGISHPGTQRGGHTRAGRSKRVGVQVQSVAHLPRRALRSVHRPT